jgi:N-6 DNA methylase
VSFDSFSARIRDFADPPRAARSLIFLHELTAAHPPLNVPAVANWSLITRVDADQVGAALDLACAACAAHWSTQLDGFFGDHPFAHENPRTLAEAIPATEGMLRAVGKRDGFHREDVLGVVHTTFRGQRDLERSGSFYTPRDVSRLLTRLGLGAVTVQAPWVYDGACGTGAELRAALDLYRAQVGDQGALAMTLIGVDRDPEVCRIARAALLMEGAHPDQYWIGAGDTLTQPLLGEDQTGAIRELGAADQRRSGEGLGAKVTAKATAQDPQPLVIPSRVIYRPIPRPTAPTNTPPAAPKSPKTKPRRPRAPHKS